eukprot:9589115-Prorocentrum_lima.AAC.1
MPCFFFRGGFRKRRQRWPTEPRRSGIASGHLGTVGVCSKKGTLLLRWFAPASMVGGLSARAAPC